MNRTLDRHLILVLLLLISTSLFAQSRGSGTSTSNPRTQPATQPKIVTRQDDPLNRNPANPSAYDLERESMAAHSEVEAVIKQGNEARAATPPRLEEAEKAYLRAVDLNPKEARAYLGLGNVYAARNLADETIKAFQKAIELKPKLSEAHFNLGMVYNAIGKKDKALEECEALQPLNKDLAKKLKEIIDKAHN